MAIGPLGLGITAQDLDATPAFAVISHDFDDLSLLAAGLSGSVDTGGTILTVVATLAGAPAFMGPWAVGIDQYEAAVITLNKSSGALSLTSALPLLREISFTLKVTDAGGLTGITTVTISTNFTGQNCHLRTCLPNLLVRALSNASRLPPLLPPLQKLHQQNSHTRSHSTPLVPLVFWVQLQHCAMLVTRRPRHRPRPQTANVPNANWDTWMPILMAQPLAWRADPAML